MKVYENVRSVIRPGETVIDEYSVWINTDIREIDVHDGKQYEYMQTQYSKDEYIRKTQADVEYIAMMTEVELE